MGKTHHPCGVQGELLPCRVWVEPNVTFLERGANGMRRMNPSVSLHALREWQRGGRHMHGAGGERMQRETGRGAVITMDAAGAWLSVRGHRGILEYGGSVLRLRVSTGAVRITGEGLVLESMDGEDILVCGRIEGVELVRGK